MKTNNLGYPRIGSDRELKKANEHYWSGKISADNLLAIGKNIRKENWTLQFNAGIDLIPSNDFSFYDQVLDLSLMLGVIPEQYQAFAKKKYSSRFIFCNGKGRSKRGARCYSHGND
jgi:5-methyltetrahydropteroyltriglutamate--homocysteine methyltransferase